MEKLYNDYETITTEVEGYQHGQTGHCPVCGAPGRFDMLKKQYPEFENWIALNESNSTWECHDCWLK